MKALMHWLPQINNFLPLPKYKGPVAQSIEILMLQPTPFCNINCDYCYLPNRDARERMSVDTIRASVQMVLDAGLIDRRLSIVWHAGEPFVLPIRYYEEAFAAIREVVDCKFEVVHNFQTNGCLIDDAWCRFTKEHHVRIGVSIDGPAFLHDLHRKTRLGRPTHAQCMRGVQKLKEYGIPFHAIAVITADTLDHEDSIFRFFEELGMTEVGFNIEELEGDHCSSSLTAEAPTDRIQKFWQRLYELNEASSGTVQIREFRKATAAILMSRGQASWQEIAKGNDQVLPFRILSVDCQGQVSTFSPELLGVRDHEYSDFIFGKVGREGLAAIRSSEPFRKVANAVMKGVKACARNCEYFSVCGGGAPSNKYFENKSLVSTTTMYCRTSIQLPIQVVLNGVESKLHSIGSPDRITNPVPLDGGKCKSMHV